MKRKKPTSKKSTKTFNILFIPTANSGVAFWRVANFIPGMLPHADVMSLPIDFKQQTCSNWELGFRDPKKGQALTHNLMGMIDKADAVVFQLFRTHYGVAFFGMLIDAIKNSKSNKLIYTEIDDNFTNVNPEIIGHMSYHAGSVPDIAGKQQLQLSHGVIVSTGNLQKEFRRYNRNIHVMPNCIDFNIWDNIDSTRKKSKKITIGYAGGAGHTKDLTILDRTIDQIVEKYGNKVEFVFMGCVPKFLRGRKGVRPIDKHYNINKYPRALANMNMDIGLAPLNDNEFNRGKSNLRWLEYSALKIPTVVSNVEPFTKSVKDKETGFICKHEGHWFQYIDKLIASEELRKEIGNNAYNAVKKDYNVVGVGKHYVDTLRGGIQT